MQPHDAPSLRVQSDRLGIHCRFFEFRKQLQIPACRLPQKIEALLRDQFPQILEADLHVLHVGLVLHAPCLAVRFYKLKEEVTSDWASCLVAPFGNLQQVLHARALAPVLPD
jgi:hypothetical protein